MIPSELVDRLAAARRRLPAETWDRLAAGVATLPSRPDPQSVQETTAAVLNRDAAWILSEALLGAADATWSEIAAAMMAVGHLVGDGRPVTEIIWTGPANNRYPVRRIDQVLYDLIAGSQRRVVLVTFAAHRVRHLCDHLTQAVQRGVQLTLIVESEDESEGQLTSDAIRAFAGVPAAKLHLYYWPAAQRERNQAGRPGKLHAKCAIIDDVALIGSANLTDDAFNRNMELGVLVRDPITVTTIADHFDELVRRGILKRVLGPTP